MANKYFRKNLNKGGGADTGKIGEIKSKLATIGNPFKRTKTTKPKLKAPKRKPMKPLKGDRAALRLGTKKNFNKKEREIQKKVDRDALVFGAKKAIERAKGKDKLKKVFDSKTNQTIFKSISDIQKDMDRFRPVEGNITKMLKADDKGSPFINAVQKIMKKRELDGRFSNADIKLAEEAVKRGLKMKKGGRAKMMGGGMMGRRFGMKEGTPPPFVRREDGKPKKPPIRTRPGQNPKGKNVPILERAPKGLPTRRKKMMGGGSLKPVDPKTQKGLSKLPTEVRNKMGYMKKGGRA